METILPYCLDAINNMATGKKVTCVSSENLVKKVFKYINKINRRKKLIIYTQEKFKDTKGVIRSCKSKIPKE